MENLSNHVYCLLAMLSQKEPEYANAAEKKVATVAGFANGESLMLIHWPPHTLLLLAHPLL